VWAIAGGELTDRPRSNPWQVERLPDRNLIWGGQLDRRCWETEGAAADDDRGSDGAFRTATKTLAPDAWCNSSTSSAPTLFSKLSQHYQTDEEINDLFQLARADSGSDGLPCKKQPQDQHHRYQVNSQRPFRIICYAPGFYHMLQRAAILHWIAELVRTEVIDGASLGQ
jgi:hypothetical protein